MSLNLKSANWALIWACMAVLLLIGIMMHHVAGVERAYPFWVMLLVTFGALAYTSYKPSGLMSLTAAVGIFCVFASQAAIYYGMSTVENMWVFATIVLILAGYSFISKSKVNVVLSEQNWRLVASGLVAVYGVWKTMILAAMGWLSFGFATVMWDMALAVLGAIAVMQMYMGKDELTAKLAIVGLLIAALSVFTASAPPLSLA